MSLRHVRWPGDRRRTVLQRTTWLAASQSTLAVLTLAVVIGLAVSKPPDGSARAAPSPAANESIAVVVVDDRGDAAPLPASFSVVLRLLDVHDPARARDDGSAAGGETALDRDDRVAGKMDGQFTSPPTECVLRPSRRADGRTTVVDRNAPAGGSSWTPVEDDTAATKACRAVFGAPEDRVVAILGSRPEEHHPWIEDVRGILEPGGRVVFNAPADPGGVIIASIPDRLTEQLSGPVTVLAPSGRCGAGAVAGNDVVLFVDACEAADDTVIVRFDSGRAVAVGTPDAAITPSGELDLDREAVGLVGAVTVAGVPAQPGLRLAVAVAGEECGQTDVDQNGGFAVGLRAACSGFDAVDAAIIDSGLSTTVALDADRTEPLTFAAPDDDVLLMGRAQVAEGPVAEGELIRFTAEAADAGGAGEMPCGSSRVQRDGAFVARVPEMCRAAGSVRATLADGRSATVALEDDASVTRVELLLTGADEIGREPPNRPTTVSFTLDVLNLLEFDERATTVDVDLFLNAQWNDWRHASPACDGDFHRLYEGSSVGELLQGGLWWPNLKIDNAVGPRETSGRALKVHCNGQVNYEERFVVTLSQGALDFNRFFRDSQLIFVQLEPFTQETDRVVFAGNVATADTSTQAATRPRVALPPPDATWTSDEWAIDPAFVAQPIIENPDRGKASARFVMRIEREEPYYFLNIVFPLVLIVAISWSVFWMRVPPMSLSDRIGVSIACFLSVVAFDFLTNGELPRLSYTTRLDILYIGSYLAIAATVAISIIVYWRCTATGRAGVPDGTGGTTTDGAASSGDRPFKERDPGPRHTLDFWSRIAFPIVYAAIVAAALWGPTTLDTGARDRLQLLSGQQTSDEDGREDPAPSELDIGATTSGEIVGTDGTRQYDLGLGGAAAFELVVEPDAGLDAVVTLTLPSTESIMIDDGVEGGTERVTMAAPSSASSGVPKVLVEGSAGSTGMFDVAVREVALDSLAVGEQVAGDVVTPQDATIYQVELDQGLTYEVIVEPDEELDAVVTLRSPGQPSVTVDDGSGGTPERIVTVASSDAYEVLVEGGSASTGGFDVRIGEITPREVALAVDETVASEIVGADDVQVHRVDVEVGNAYEVVVEPGAGFDPKVTVGSPGEESDVVDDGGAGVSERIVTIASGDVHEVLVEGWAGSVGPYDVTVREVSSDELRVGGTVSGEITAAGDVRYARVGLDDGKAYRVVVRPDDDFDAVMTVLSPGGEPVTVDDSEPGASERIVTVGSGGEHEVLVEAGGETTGSYELTVDEVRPDELSVGDGTTGEIAGSGDVVIFSVESAGQAFEVVVEPDAGFDAVVTVVPPNDESIIVDDDGEGGTERIVTVAADEEHQVRVVGFEGSTGSFDVAFNEV